MDKHVEAEYVDLLRQSKNDDESLDRLEKFYQKHSHNDPDNKILTAYLNEKSRILIIMEKYDEALEASRTLKSILSGEDKLIPLVIYNMTICYDKLGNKSMAISLIESGYFTNTTIRSVTQDIQFLNIFREIIGEEKFPQKYTETVASLYAHFGAEMDNPSDLKTQIKKIYETNKASNRKYHRLLLDIQRLGKEDKVSKIEEYIQQEQLGRYRNMAIALLDKQKAN